MRYQNVLFGSMALLVSAGAVGHGLVSDPASRNWFCGAITKPDTAEPGSACAQAFEDDFNGGYQFMSVLTHDVGRKGVSPLPTNVCGFDSETWNGGATPWDKPIDWPTNQISAGEQTFTWDISWGPHFGDTEEFVYYITKPGFEYQVGEPLTWDDFESEPFCNLTGYDDSNPSATPNIVPEKGESLFHTTCTVPEREGRHVIYAEWGRNYFTYERFHGCIDVEFGGGNGGPDPVVASINANPGNSVFAGAGTIELSAANSQGSNLSYNWSVEPGDDATYSLSGTSGASTTLTLADTDVENDVTVRLQVSNSDGSDSADYVFTHIPATGTSWEAIGPLTNEAQTLSEGDEVQLRMVTNDGEDVYLPTNPLVISSDTTTASAWSYALANEINSENTDVRVGVLNDNGDVEAVNSATENRVFAQVPSNYTGAYLQIEPQDSSSSSSSSSEPTTGQQCNWYGTTTPLCDNQDSGWGYENGQSCVGATTCSGQPDPYGIIGGGDSSSSQSSSVASSVSSSVASSSAPSGGNCEYVIQNQWNGGFTASIVITNNGASAINGWNVSWDYSGSTQVTNSWNAEVSGSGPYTASDMGWNGTIQPGESVEFGFQGSGAADVPEVTGSVCN